MNTIDAFHRSVASEDHPPSDLTAALEALWWDAKGDWRRAHEATQADADASVSWAHAYLHRKEGDLSNAAYWYAKAERPVAEGSLEAERDSIVETLLQNQT